MAGIGFELRQQIDKDTYAGALRAYALAGVVGSGPWVISIGSMLLIGTLTRGRGYGLELVTPFLATVTYLMAILRDGPRVAQVGFIAAPKADLDSDAFVALARRALDRLGELEVD